MNLQVVALSPTPNAQLLLLRADWTHLLVRRGLHALLQTTRPLEASGV